MIEIKDLTLTYPKTKKTSEFTALKNVNLLFENDTFYVVIGSSGSGKTSLLSSISGFLKYQGDIFFDGDNAKNIPISDRDIALVNQNYVLYPHMTIFENIAFPLRSRGASKQEILDSVYEVSDILGLNYLLSRKPKELSGGQQQRVALARALVKKPKIYLFDEPLSNVSDELRDVEREMIRKAVKQYRSIAIYVTHNIREATALADKIIVLDEGKVVLSGTPKEIIKSKDKIVNQLFEASNVI